MTKVLLTTDAVGGVWTYALDLARGLAAAGVQPVLAVMGPSPSADQRETAGEIAGLQLVDTGLTLDWMAEEPGRIEAASRGIRTLAGDVGADLIHLNSPALALVGGFPAPVLGACHSCLATWWQAVKGGPMPEDFRWRTEALRRGLAACDALVAPSAAFARATANAYGLPQPHVVYNGRAPAALAARPDRRRGVFTSGRLWDEGKNVAVLDAAAGQAGIDLRAAGPLDGPSGLNHIDLRHATALGALSAEAVQHELEAASIFASSALYEPFGLGVLEAAQAGCTLVLSDIPTFRELWDGAAVFVQPTDSQGFAAAFRRLQDGPAQAQDLGLAAQRRADAYTVQAMTDGVLALYRQLERTEPARGRAA